MKQFFLASLVVFLAFVGWADRLMAAQLDDLIAGAKKEAPHQFLRPVDSHAGRRRVTGSGLRQKIRPEYEIDISPFVEHDPRRGEIRRHGRQRGGS